MDPFSHLLLGYLLGFGLWGPNSLNYVVAAAVAGGLPDADVALYPLARRFPLLRHRGISHSIVGVTIIAVVGTWLVPWALGLAFGPAFAAGAAWAYFVSLEVGGLSHVLLDAMDHWTVPIFAPFSDREYGFDADRIANFGAMSFTIAAYAILLYEHNRAPLWAWEVTSWVLLAAVGTFFVVRLGARWWIEGPRRKGGYTSVVPQVNPFCFLLYAEKTVAPGVLEMRYARFDLLRGGLLPRGSVKGFTEKYDGHPAPTAAEAIAISFGPAMKKSWFLAETNRFARSRATNLGFEVFWYSLEMSFWGRAAGVLAEVDSNGSLVSVRSAWRNPNRFGQIAGQLA